MKRIALFLAVSSLHAASYYVSSTGNDSTGTGSSSAPWLTLAHAVSAVANGDTIIIVANGNKVTCDAALPATITNITVQSSKLAMLPPVGYRVNPATDSASFGKCQFSGIGIIASGEVYGHNAGQTYQQASVDLTTNTFTITGPGWVENGYAVANGTQIEPELYIVFAYTAGTTMPPTTAVPTPLVALTHYYIVNCAPSGPACGRNGSTFQLAATPGGSPIDITACDSDCALNTTFGLPVQADPSADTITSTQGLSGTYVNGLAITFSSGSLRLPSNLPAPLAQDTLYYVCNLSGRTFKLGTTSGCGTTINITDVGTGMQSFSNQLVPHGWKFSGIEFAPTSGNHMGSLVQVGNGGETSVLSMPDSFEFDRNWFHDYSATDDGPVRAILDNSTNLYVHDSWFDGIKDTSAESQCITGISSYGPTRIINNFLECMTENVMYGGGVPNYYPVTNQNKTITGNYFYKPFLWKNTTGAYGTPSGTCLYDAASSPDPRHRGGEYVYDTVGSQGWVCVGGTWTMTGTPPFTGTVKNLLEFKSGRIWTVSGNVFEGNWLAGQAGQALTFGQNDDSGPGTANDHLTVTNNKISKVYRLLTWGSHCTGGAGVGNNPCVNGTPNNQNLINNLYVGGGPPYCTVTFNTAGCNTQMWTSLYTGYATLQNRWDHNTIVEPDGLASTSPYFPQSFLYEITPATPLNDQDTYTNSIDSYDFFGQKANFAGHWTNSIWNRMVLKGAAGDYTSGGSGSGNVFSNTSLPANNTAVGFVNPSAGDYHLSPTSPYSASCTTGCVFKSSDGTDLGADIDLVNMATSGAVAGTPPWDQQAGLQLTAGSTQIVFRYKAPTSTACTATIYNAPARISANQAASVADSSANSVSDVLDRQLYISGLTASKNYWYKLACGGGVLMVGDVSTRAAGSGTSQFSFDWNAPVAMQYSSSRSMSGAVSLPAATRQFIPVPANSVVYAQVGTTGPITILIAP